VWSRVESGAIQDCQGASFPKLLLKRSKKGRGLS